MLTIFTLPKRAQACRTSRIFLIKKAFETHYNLLDLNSLKFNPEDFKQFVPCIVPVKNTQGQHYVVIKGMSGKKLQILDPAKGQSYNWSFPELVNQAYSGTANYDYVSNSQMLQHIISNELTAYNIDADAVII